jgi:glycosyltransferase involved in cell wall biosynthesis
MNATLKPLVPIVYPFFAHYRAGVNLELMRSTRFNFLFVGSSKPSAGTGIKCWEFPEGANFIDTKLRYLFRRVLVQSEVVRLSLCPGIRSMIFLGDASYATTWLAAFFARITGKRVFFWTHGWTEPDRGIKKYFRIAFYRLAHEMFIYGHHAKRIGMNFGFQKERLHVIYNSLDYAAQIAARESVKEEELPAIRAGFFGGQAARPLLICTGRLIPMRQIDRLFEAMGHLQKDGFQVNLLLIGDGPDMPALKAHAERNGLSVHFYGTCYDEALLSRFFMTSDLLVMPGRIGLSAMHSLAFGTPVVVHDNPNDQGPEWESIIPGYNGAHYSHGDSRDLARVIRQWLEGAHDRQSIRANCYEILDRFYNPAVQAALIERALEGKPADDQEWDEFKRSRSVSMPDRLGEPNTREH